MNTRRLEKDTITEIRGNRIPKVKGIKRAAEMRRRATMQTNTAEVGPASLINGCGCLLYPPANNTAARSIYHFLRCAINEV